MKNSLTLRSWPTQKKIENKARKISEHNNNRIFISYIGTHAYPSIRWNDNTILWDWGMDEGLKLIKYYNTSYLKYISDIST